MESSLKVKAITTIDKINFKFNVSFIITPTLINSEDVNQMILSEILRLEPGDIVYDKKTGVKFEVVKVDVKMGERLPLKVKLIEQIKIPFIVDSYGFEKIFAVGETTWLYLDRNVTLSYGVNPDIFTCERLAKFEVDPIANFESLRNFMQAHNFEITSAEVARSISKKNSVESLTKTLFGMINDQSRSGKNCLVVDKHNYQKFIPALKDGGYTVIENVPDLPENFKIEW